MSIMFALIFCNKKWCDYWATTRGLKTDYAIEEESNQAVALSRGGLYLGLGVAMFGVISGPSQGFVNDMLAISGYGALVSLFFLCARTFSSTVVLRFVKNTEELKRGNIAVGWIEAGSYVATGIIAMSSMMGQGGNALTATAFFIIGQLLLLAASFLYEVTTKWSVKDEVTGGNPAEGLLFAGIVVAMAIALHGAIATDFIGWSYNLTFFIIEGLLALAFMVILSRFVDWVFLPGTDIETEVVRDKNVAAICVVVAVKLAGALAISAAVI
jgi:uncharacterized membrane protein YjfL (UPF0719 family)